MRLPTLRGDLARHMQIHGTSELTEQLVMSKVYGNGMSDFSRLPPDEVVFGTSGEMSLARANLQLAARSDVPVLLQGESGTGKDILARLLHARSSRGHQPWVKVMCPAIPHSLIESELFGHERGAFTGANCTKRGRVELAHGSTLFLDEVGGLDLAVQAKLLQLLQDGSFTRVGGQETLRVQIRIVSSANVNLRRKTDEGSFRLDLLYRLNAITINLPPLRNRIHDLPVLIDYFLHRYSDSLQRAVRPLSSQTLTQMRRFSWPGNIRQLENLIRSYVVIGDEDVLRADMFPEAEPDEFTQIDLAQPVCLKQITKSMTAKLEQEIIRRVLEAQGGSRRKTARWLNISYRSLLYKLGEAHSLDGIKTE
ncbi:sigma-54-dependent Fis family transcriptional regulator [Acidobacteria bacterium AB60]|nr:sigma-54-dependent Fis family transcriptional regulator [Acidobacteria bacterium AB60]